MFGRLIGRNISTNFTTTYIIIFVVRLMMILVHTLSPTLKSDSYYQNFFGWYVFSPIIPKNCDMSLPKDLVISSWKPPLSSWNIHFLWQIFTYTIIVQYLRFCETEKNFLIPFSSESISILAWQSRWKSDGRISGTKSDNRAGTIFSLLSNDTHDNLPNYHIFPRRSPSPFAYIFSFNNLTSNKIIHLLNFGDITTSRLFDLIPLGPAGTKCATWLIFSALLFC